jgi:N-acetylglutamate synthase-like GNAT family acetyltransferase
LDFVERKGMQGLVEAFCKRTGNDFRAYFNNINLYGNIWYIQEGDKVIGFCHAHVTTELEQPRSVCHVTGIYIRPGRRSKTKMLEVLSRLKEYAKRHDCSRIVMYTSRKARRFWESVGFRKESEIYEVRL